MLFRSGLIRALIAERTDPVLFAMSYDYVGDLSETAALMWPAPAHRDGVVPSLHVDYKKSRIKQYHKEGQALSTETTINDTRDFAIGRRIENLQELRQIGFAANRRLLDVQRIGHDCFIGEASFQDMQRPVTVDGWSTRGSVALR